MKKLIFIIVILIIASNIFTNSIIVAQNLENEYSNWSSKLWVGDYSTQIQWKKMGFEKAWSAYRFYNGYNEKMFICWKESTGFYGCETISPQSNGNWTALSSYQERTINITKIEIGDEKSISTGNTGNKSIISTDNDNNKEYNQYEFSGEWISDSGNKFLIQVGLNVLNRTTGYFFLWTRVEKNLYKTSIYDNISGKTYTYYYTILNKNKIKVQSETGINYWTKIL